MIFFSYIFKYKYIMSLFCQNYSENMKNIGKSQHDLLMK